ncbi:MAG: putative membrane-bound dehydrogenase-like protein [Planctomycetota bacterium]|jgi:putative membrane-bound dehydrogenase-like protein
MQTISAVVFSVLSTGLNAQEAADSRDLTNEFVLPEGLSATLWADSPQLFNPTAMDVDARGRVWVTEAVNYRKWNGRNPGLDHPDGDRVVILEDTTSDGVCDSSKVFVQDVDLTSPLGIAVIGDKVYVSCSPNLFVFTDSDGDDVPDSREVFLTGFGGFDHDHGLHSVVAGPDGRLYLNTGNAGPHVVTDRDGWTLRSGSLYNGGGPTIADNKPGLISDDGKLWTGGLALRIGQDGSGLEVIAHNFRNNYELALDSFGNIYQTDNDDDGNQSCRTLWCMEGGNFGFFSNDGSRSWQADRRPGQSTWTAHWHHDDPGVVPSGAKNGAGGPTGIAIYEGELLDEWIGNAVLNADAGAGVVYAHRTSARGADIELANGDLLRARPDIDDRDAKWFRPSDVVVGIDGSVYVADWYDPGVGGHLAGDREAYGRILRIAPGGHTKSDIVIDVATVAGALDAIASPAVNVRELGRRALIKAKSDAGPALRDLFVNSTSPTLQARALWLLASPEFGERDFVLAQLNNKDANLRVTAIRALAQSSGGTLPLALMRAHKLAEDVDASVRREVLLNLRGVPLDASRDLLLELAKRYDGEDRMYLEAFGLAAEGHEEELYPILLTELGTTPDQWDARFEGLAWRLHPVAATEAFTSRVLDPDLPGPARQRSLDALAFTKTREAADAVLIAAQAGPSDLRDYAAQWIRHRSGNDWRSFGLKRQLGSAELENANLVWESGLIRKGLVEAKLDVANAELLWLVVTDGGNGNSCDWANWIEPQFLDANGNEIPGAMDWMEAQAQWGNVEANRNCVGTPLIVGDVEFARGIGTHANSRIAMLVPEDAAAFVTRAGPDQTGVSQNDGQNTSIEFQVFVTLDQQANRVGTWVAQMLDQTLSADERDDAAAQLASDPGGGLVAIRMAQHDQLNDELKAIITEAIHTNPDLGVRALASEHFPKPGLESLSTTDVLSLTGDPNRGRALFLDAKRSQCMTCHSYTLGESSLGGDIGPNLTSIRDKYAAPEILDAILNPSAAIAFGYDTWLIEMKSGELLTGFLLADGPTVILKDNQGKRIVLESEDIASRWKQSLSTMPEGLATGMNAQQLSDLVAFLSDDPERAPVFGEAIELFDGKSLEGWTHHLTAPNVSMDDVWSVKEGILTCSGNPAGYIRTEESYESFHLVVEWRFDPELGPGNSGVLLRLNGPDKVWPRSIEAQLQHRNAGDIWNIGEIDMRANPARTRGRNTSRAQPSSELPLGEWNRYDILMDGPRLELRVNGVLQNTVDWCEIISGPIALQSEGAAIQFRSVKLRPIE